MSRSMRAYRMVDWGSPPELVEVAIPRPSDGELLVRVAGNGLCHSDVTMMTMPRELGEALGWQMPFTLGHETAGWIEEVGGGVVGCSRGDAVALVSPSSCSRCAWCLMGQENLCDSSLLGRGYGQDGGLAEYVLVTDQRYALPLSELDPTAAGPLTDAGATSHHVVARVLDKLEDDTSFVTVIGAGGLGIFAIQLLLALSPARVIAIDQSAERRSLAEETGAHFTIDGVDRSTAARLREITSGKGCAAVLDVVGTDHTISVGLKALAKRGSFALVGAGGGKLDKPWFGSLPHDAEVFTFQGSSIADAKAVIALAEQGLIRSDIDRFALDEVADAYAALDAGTLRGRAVVVP